MNAHLRHVQQVEVPCREMAVSRPLFEGENGQKKDLHAIGIERGALIPRQDAAWIAALEQAPTASPLLTYGVSAQPV